MAWDAAQRYRGLGWRGIEAKVAHSAYDITEHPVSSS
jgi:hypothetical protein